MRYEAVAVLVAAFNQCGGGAVETGVEEGVGESLPAGRGGRTERIGGCAVAGLGGIQGPAWPLLQTRRPAWAPPRTS